MYENSNENGGGIEIGWFREGVEICYYQNNMKKKNSGFYYTLTFTVNFSCNFQIFSMKLIVFFSLKMILILFTSLIAIHILIHNCADSFATSKTNHQINWNSKEKPFVRQLLETSSFIRNYFLINFLIKLWYSWNFWFFLQFSQKRSLSFCESSSRRDYDKLCDRAIDHNSIGKLPRI